MATPLSSFAAASTRLCVPRRAARRHAKERCGIRRGRQRCVSTSASRDVVDTATTTGVSKSIAPNPGSSEEDPSASSVPTGPRASVRGARTLGWGRRRGAIPPDSDLLDDPETHGYCVYSHADWSYAYKSVEGEFDYHIAPRDVEGRVPDALRNGVLYRAGPGLFERGGVEYKHMLDGDGYSLRFQFTKDGGALFRSRFVRTEEFKSEEAADAVVYRGTFGTMRDGGPTANAFDLHQKNLANTNILAWGGKVYALYEAGRPVELDPETLDALGESSLGGKLTPGMFISLGAPFALEAGLGLGGRAFTAHPHTDPHTGRIVGWGWKSLVAKRSVEATFWEWDEDWNARAEAVHMLSGCEAAPHDFAVTQSWYVMIQNCLQVDPLPYLLGVRGAGESLISRPEEPVTVHLVARPGNDRHYDGRRQKRLSVTAKGPRESFEIHVALAHDGPPLAEGADVSPDAMDDFVTVYTAGWEKLAPGSFLGEWSASAGWDFDIATTLSPDFNAIPRTLLWRYRINAKTGEVVRDVTPGCDDLCIDHPHVNPLYEGRRECRYVYASISNEVACSGPPLGYVRVDLATGETQKWWAGNRCFCEELVIVPKTKYAWDGSGSGGIGDAEAFASGMAGMEEDCWLLGMVADHSDVGGGKSSLVVLDGADLEKGPVARIWLKHRIPHGLHGAFVPGKRGVGDSRDRTAALTR